MGPRRDRDAGRRTRRTPGRGVLGHRVRRRDRAARPRPARPTSARPSSSATASSRVWSRVVKGDLPAWRARRVARETMLLSMEAAAYVDRHVAHVAHKVRPAQLDRLVEEAIGRFMPEEAERRRRQAADGRSFTVDTRQPSLAGTSNVYGELDLADALDLDAAVAAGAQALKDLGSTDTLDVRRATAVGDLARRQLTLDLNPTTRRDIDGDGDVRQPVGTATGDGDRRSGPRRPHGREEDPQAAPGGAVRAPLRRRRGPRRPVGRASSGGSRTPGVRCTPSRSGSGAATPTPRSPCNRSRPERAHRRRGLRDPRPAAGTDHPDPPDLRVPLVHPTRPRPGARRARRRLRPPGPLREGPAQLLLQHRPALPRHHRAKTHGGWSYTALERGTYVWTSPHGYQYLRDHHGTLDVSRDRHPAPAGPLHPPPGRLTPPPRHPAGPPPAGTSARPGQSRTVPTGSTGTMGCMHPPTDIPQGRRVVWSRTDRPAIEHGPAALPGVIVHELPDGWVLISLAGTRRGAPDATRAERRAPGGALTAAAVVG